MTVLSNNVYHLRIHIRFLFLLKTEFKPNDLRVVRTISYADSEETILCLKSKKKCRPLSTTYFRLYLAVLLPMFPALIGRGAQQLVPDLVAVDYPPPPMQHGVRRLGTTPTPYSSRPSSPISGPVSPRDWWR